VKKYHSSNSSSLLSTVSGKFLHLQDQIQKELASRITAALAQRHQSADPIVVIAHSEVHMLTPRPERKDTEVLLVTSETWTPAPPSGGKVKCSTSALSTEHTLSNCGVNLTNDLLG